MVDLNKIKERLNSQQSKRSDNNKESIFFKPTKAGKYAFRCVAYPHVKDSDSEPFAEKYYHFNVPGHYAVYCPEKNDGEKCALCRICWDNMKTFKGNKDAQEEWREKLPQLNVIVPGKFVGHFDENDELVLSKDEPKLKFLKFRSSYEKDKDGKLKMSENHKKLYAFFSKEANWLDWKRGCDVEMTYEAPKEGQKTRFATAVMLARGGLELARNSTKRFESQEEYNQFVSEIPNLDNLEPWNKKTSADIVAIMEKWQKSAEEKAVKLMSESRVVKSVNNNDDIVIESDEEPTEEVETKKVKNEPVQNNAVQMSQLEARLKNMFSR